MNINNNMQRQNSTSFGRLYISDAANKVVREHKLGEEIEKLKLYLGDSNATDSHLEIRRFLKDFDGPESISDYLGLSIQKASSTDNSEITFLPMFKIDKNVNEQKPELKIFDKIIQIAKDIANTFEKEKLEQDKQNLIKRLEQDTNSSDKLELKKINTKLNKIDQEELIKKYNIIKAKIDKLTNLLDNNQNQTDKKKLKEYLQFLNEKLEEINRQIQK